MLHAILFWPFWSPFHGLFSLIFVIAILALIFGRRRYYYDHPWHWTGGSRSDALAILEGRYARGEIQREEYLQKKHDLGG
jgi:putative membrane protein